MQTLVVHGKYCDVDFSVFPLLRVKSEGIKEYFDDKYPKIIELLKPAYNYYRKVTVEFLRISNPFYRNRIIKIDPDQHLSGDNLGCLIHESAHAVQNYKEGINSKHPCWWLMEGIADYCRWSMCNDIEIYRGDPKEGYRKAAFFLSKLAETFGQEKIKEINEIIHDKSSEIAETDGGRDIFLFKEIFQKDIEQLKGILLYKGTQERI